MITINKTKPNTKTWQYAYIIFTVDGDICKMVVSTPIVENLQAYCDIHELEYKVNALGAMYPDARWQETTGKTDLEKFKKWIAAGCINKTYVDEEGMKIPEQTIKKVFWADMFGEQTEIEKLADRVMALEAVKV